jgi:hypothetical protein
MSIGHTKSSQSVTVFTSRSLVAAFNGGRSRFAGFLNYHRLQLSAFHSNCSQQLNPKGFLTDCNLLTNRQTLCSLTHHIDTDRVESTFPLLNFNCCLAVTYFTVACAAIGADRVENTIPPLPTGHCLVTAGCCDSTIPALSEYATIFNFVRHHSHFPFLLFFLSFSPIIFSCSCLLMINCFKLFKVYNRKTDAIRMTSPSRD